MAEIKFENVSKSFGKTTVIENMNLTLPDGKFTVLLGPSGYSGSVVKTKI